MDYDIAIIGLGPAGAILARQLKTKFKVIAFDKKQKTGDAGFQKPCGGLLAIDAQRSLARLGLSLPNEVLVNPQIFSVKTIDLQSHISCDYQRNYININRHRFDLWLKSLIPTTVDVRHDTLCKQVLRQHDGYRIAFIENGIEKAITARYVVGADGANSMIRREIYPHHQIRKYLSIQQWFDEQHPKPFFSCIFDQQITDCYTWSMSKNNSFILGGAFEMKTANQRFEEIKNKLSLHSFMFDKPVKTEKCTVLYPSKFTDFCCGKDNAFLIGEAAGFISASSLEGISYALDSANILSKIFNDDEENPNQKYFYKTLKLKTKLSMKIVKANVLTHPLLRKAIMRSKLFSLSINS